MIPLCQESANYRNYALVKQHKPDIIEQICNEQLWHKFSHVNHILVLDCFNYVNVLVEECHQHSIDIENMIDEQHPKPNKHIFVKTSMSPFEIARLSVNPVFFLPIFLTGSTDHKFILNSTRNNKQYDKMVEVILVINVSEYNDKTTIIKKTQNDELYNNGVCLISCYNLYEYCGYFVDEERIYIQLTLKYPLKNEELQLNKKLIHKPIPEKLYRASHVFKSRSHSSSKTVELMTILFDELVNGKLINKHCQFNKFLKCDLCGLNDAVSFCTSCGNSCYCIVCLEKQQYGDKFAKFTSCPKCDKKLIYVK